MLHARDDATTTLFVQNMSSSICKSSGVVASLVCCFCDGISFVKTTAYVLDLLIFSILFKHLQSRRNLGVTRKILVESETCIMASLHCWNVDNEKQRNIVKSAHPVLCSLTSPVIHILCRMSCTISYWIHL